MFVIRVCLAEMTYVDVSVGCSGCGFGRYEDGEFLERIIILNVYCRYFVVNFKISYASAALAMFLTFHLRPCYGSSLLGGREKLFL